MRLPRPRQVEGPGGTVVHATPARRSSGTTRSEHGVLMRTMLFPRLLTIALLLFISTSVVRADALSDLMKSAALGNAERARIDTIVSERADRLRETGGDQGKRNDAREGLINPAQTSGATPEALAFYAEVVGQHLSPLLVGADRSAANDAALILRRVNQKQTINSLITGVSSPFESVQFQCVAAIRDLHPAIAEDGEICRDVLRALAKAGGSTSNAPLLRAIYGAANFAGTSPKYSLFDEQVTALIAILNARIDRLQTGARDEIKDIPGLEALGAAAPKAGKVARKNAMPVLAFYYRLVAERYSDRDVADEYISTVRRLAEAVEKAIVDVLRAEQIQPPSTSYRSTLELRRTRESVEGTNKASEQMMELLRKPPFELP